MHGLGFNNYASVYLSKVATTGTIPHVLTPWKINKFASDWFRIFIRKPGSVYPFIGAEQKAHAADLFGKFDIEWQGTATVHTASGAAGAGVGNYGLLGPANELIPNMNSCSMGVYCNVNTTGNEGEIGGASGGLNTGLITKWGTTGCYGQIAGPSTGWHISNIGTAASGAFWSLRRYGSASSDIYRNGIGVYGATNVSTSLPNNLGVCGWSGGYSSSRRLAFAFVSGTYSDVVGAYNLVQELQVHLGRNV